jgi:uncharacterized protein YhaN
MKFEALHLERYGAFEDVTFDFSGDDVGLHIIYGPNEAGKSTVLSAIGDLLFGIPARTPYNFRHDYSKLRIGAEIVDSTGRNLSFKRRKANAGTLLTAGAAETTLADSVLTPFLGGVSRELFTRMFGLDHARLREGGDQMLRSGGDLARSLFEAGSGLSGIGAVLQSLEAEIEAIGDLTRRAKTKPIWREIDTFVDATQSVRRDGLKAEEWRQAEQALERARSERHRIDEDLARIRQRRAQLERVRRAAPLLNAMERLASQLAQFGDLPALPAGFAEEWRRRDQALRDARLALRNTEEALRDATSELERIPESGSIIEFGNDIEVLQENLGKYRKGVADEPKLIRDIAADDALIEHHLESLGSPRDPGMIDVSVPPTPLVARVRELIRHGEGIELAAGTAASELRKAQEAWRRAQEKLDALPAVADPAPVVAMTEEVWRLGDLAAQHTKAERDLAVADRSLAEALQRLSRWSESAEALAARPFPDVETVRLCEDDLRKAQERLAAAERARAEKDDEIRRVEADLAGLAAAGEVPSPAAVQAARDHRDRIWRVVRTHHIEGREPSAEDCAALGALDEVAPRYETAVRHADELVDRRESDAQRVARFSELQAQLLRFSRQKEVAESEHEQALEALNVAEARWQDLWAECGIVPGPAPGMRAWLAQKDEVLRLLGAVRQARASVEDVTAIADRARAILLRAGESLGLATDEALLVAELARLVRHRIAETERAWGERRSAAQKLDDEANRVREKTLAAEDAQASADRWKSQWAETVVKLGLPAIAGRSEAEAALTAWDEIRQRLTNKSQTVRRLEGIRRDNAEFRDALSRLVQELGNRDLDPAANPEETVRTLVSKLGAARENATRRTQAAAGHVAAVAALERAQRALEAASGAADELRAAYGLPPGADVLAIADQVEARRRCAADLEERRLAFVESCDGLGDEAVRAEVAAIAPDAAVAELAALDTDEAQLVQEGQAAAQQETSAQHALDALAGRESVTAAVQQARNAAQAATFHLERWLRLTAARKMLERALERYRAENQHPLVRRSSEIFSAMAGTGDNPIVRLDVAYGDGRDPTLVGVRRDGSECPVDGMSEGTRDQLYLSLRIAAVEQHVAANEPLPFIADDLFITSDDERVVPGLAALADLGCSTQVILFTHHRHVMAAAATLPREVVKVHRLPVPSLPAAAGAFAVGGEEAGLRA